MSQEVIGIQVDGHVIVRHSPAQVVQVEPYQRTVDVVMNDFRPQIDQFAQTGVCDRPVLAVEGDGRARCPRVDIIRVNGETACQPVVSLHRIFLLQIDFRLQRIGRRRLGPPCDDRVSILQGMVIVLDVQSADRSVGPETGHRGIEMDGPVVVSDRVSVFLLTDARHGTKIKDLFDIRVEVYGMGRVFFGTYIVVERVLRGSTVIPWQPQIRL